MTAAGAATIDAWVQDFIRENLPLRPVPGVPEIVVHRAVPSSGLRHLAERDPAFGAPYWAHEWGGGLALARYVLDHPAEVVGLRVLDLGAGSGLVGVAAALAGARSVTAADTDPYARIATGLNATANNVVITLRDDDPLDAQAPEADLVLAGDVFYDPDLARRAEAFLDRCHRASVHVLVGDPGRAWLPRNRLTALAEYPGPDFGGGAGTNTVFVFGPAGTRPLP